ncbi:DNA-binding transcriptional ArsR family regulator [Natronospira proteinivora]|uniref:DNA-binding transcriptional ArsR family regulator n=1 Tax=Natronospira proteinivora TaxID=1807133 RepID=A0ABT1G9S4_9GAMM|nr:metalloregulator ArsR/SmtB family transcription factor [Natronospira proteinivora]MCP1727043.1 DNA-binding transcriptional ArsR family regulator [Natronospira proteinivora]
MSSASHMPSPKEMSAHSEEAARILKVLANSHRLMVLCALVEGERSVSELNQEVPLSQSALSQHLARFRQEGLVETRRESQTIFYRIADPKVLELMGKLYELYCAPE